MMLIYAKKDENKKILIKDLIWGGEEESRVTVLLRVAERLDFHLGISLSSI